MKAHKPPDTFAQIRREVAAEMNRQETELFKRHAEMLIPQVYAMVLYTLATCEGYGEKRLKRFCEHIHDIDELMENPSRLHHRFDPTDLIDVVKEKYGIDVVKEFPVRVEVQK
jgi:hypothetical protein